MMRGQRGVHDEVHRDDDDDDDDDELERVQVHEVYRRVAKGCLKGTGRTLDFVKVFRQRYVLNPDVVVLDIGCGNCRNQGVFTGSIIVGCDVVEEFVKRSSQRNESLLVNCGIMCDFMHFSFNRSIFDVGLFIGVLHHICTVKRRITMLKLLRNCLVDNGVALIASAGHQRGYKPPKEGTNVDYHRYFHYFVEGELDELCITAGFTILEAGQYSEGMWHLVVQASITNNISPSTM